VINGTHHHFRKLERRRCAFDIAREEAKTEGLEGMMESDIGSING
jgi:hypothetical protein